MKKKKATANKASSSIPPIRSARRGCGTLAATREKRKEKANLKIENSSFKEEENGFYKKTIRILQRRILKAEIKKSIFFGFHQRL